jgi:hypothetical protein
VSIVASQATIPVTLSVAFTTNGIGVTLLPPLIDRASGGAASWTKVGVWHWSSLRGILLVGIVRIETLLDFCHPFTVSKPRCSCVIKGEGKRYRSNRHRRRP